MQSLALLMKVCPINPHMEMLYGIRCNSYFDSGGIDMQDKNSYNSNCLDYNYFFVR